jgi:hypothetical protein
MIQLDLRKVPKSNTRMMRVLLLLASQSSQRKVGGATVSS